MITEFTFGWTIPFEWFIVLPFIYDAHIMEDKGGN